MKTREIELFDCSVRIVDIIPADQVIFVRTDGLLETASPEDLLGPRELTIWRERFKNPERRLEWFAGRIAAKCALALLGGEQTSPPPANFLEILPDESGAPVFSGPWKYDGPQPGLSITHTSGLAAAQAAEVRGPFFPGLDLERRDRVLSERFNKAVFKPREESFLQGIEEQEKHEWRLRLWCAREAAAKSLRLGVVGLTDRIEAEKIDFASGKVYVTITGLDKDEKESGLPPSMPVQTTICGSYILAASLIS